MLSGCKVAAAVAGLVASAVLVAAPAQADTGFNDFLSDVSSIGFLVDSTNEDSFLVVGLAACVDILSGATASSVAAQVEAGAEIPAEVASRFVSMAVADLCPSAAETGGWA